MILLANIIQATLYKMISKKEIQSFLSGLLNNEPKNVLPYWNEQVKTIQPLSEVVVIKDNTKKKNILLYIPSNTFEIHVSSSSTYSIGK